MSKGYFTTDAPTATGAHDRVYRLWGSANQYPCVESCGRPGTDWLYDGTDPGELIGRYRKSPVEIVYSAFPEFYMPICRSCRHLREFGPRGCDVAKCPRPHCAKGYCNTHYAQYRDGKDPHGEPYWLTKPIGFSAAHSRCRSLWGKASQYPCIECGKQAKQWAYDGTDPTELLEGVSRGAGQAGKSSYILYSIFPEFYMPMCYGCHARRDGARAANELREYRQWRQRTGMTLADCRCGEELDD